MHLINTQYHILDVFEKNPLQSLMLGASVDNADEIVVINEVFWSPLFTRELAQSLYDGFINLKTHSEDNASCQLVTSYHKGTPIGKYLASRSLPFRNRINLCYEFLKAMVHYTEFPAWIQDILIDEDQIIVWEDQLLYNELLILKTSEADYAEKSSFTKVRKKLHSVITQLIGNPREASPALTDFLERLDGRTVELNSLQAIYEDFQKVYLYDYYLDKNDSLQPPPVPVPAPLPLQEEAAEAIADEIPDEMPVTEPDEPAAEPADDAAAETDDEVLPVPEEVPVPEALPETPEPAEEASAAMPAEVDAVDADMEKNLELFFNRDRSTSSDADEGDAAPRRKQNVLWMALGILGMLLLLWAAVHTFVPGGKPVAAFAITQKSGIWMLQNQSTFSDRTTVKRSEWTIYQNGKLIDLYDTYDLTLSLEDEGIYQVVLRVMDSDGKWSAPARQSLENHPAGAAGTAEAAKPEAEPEPTGIEKMDQFTLKFDPARTEKDTALFRTGGYSLQISPGKKPEIIEVQGILLNNNGMVSLWISSENTEAVTLTFTAYNQNTKVFTKDITHQPRTPRQWEMIQFTAETDKLINRMTIAIKADALVNLDDLSIDSYK